jgi:hypothetical protein
MVSAFYIVSAPAPTGGLNLSTSLQVSEARNGDPSELSATIARSLSSDSVGELEKLAASELLSSSEAYMLESEDARAFATITRGK